MNIWSEINGMRPAIIYKHDEYRYWEDTIVIPITSFEDWGHKPMDTFDIDIEADITNGLSHRSLIKIRQLRCISKKRFKKSKKTNNVMIIGKIEDEDLKKRIESNIKVMFWI